MNLTKKQQKRVLVKLIETYVMFGYSISHLIQKPCSHFNMKSCLRHIVELHEKHDDLSGENKQEFVSDLINEFGEFRKLDEILNQ